MDNVVRAIAEPLMAVTRSRMFLAYSATCWTPAAYWRLGFRKPPL